MSVPAVQLRTRLPHEEMKKRVGRILTAADYSLLLSGNATVFKPDGELLCGLHRRAIPASVTAAAYPALHSLRNFKTSNRGAYSGQKRKGVVFGDGVVSKNSHTTPVASAIIGYFDRQGGRHPFCRTTAFTADHVAEWLTVLPMVYAVDNLFAADQPSRYARQMDVARKTNPSFVISSPERLTPFTTLTVNNNVAPSGIHKDAGDYKGGCGVISCVRRGSYSGALLGFPEYGVAVDLHDGDVLFFNAHDWHGVTSMELLSPDAERITIVYYFREKMLECRPPVEELKRAKRVRGAL